MKCKNDQKGSFPLIAVLLMAAMSGMLILEMAHKSPERSAIASEAHLDLDIIQDKIALALASEKECQTAFTSAPLNSLTYTSGAPGADAMDLSTTGLIVRGIALVNIGQAISGGGVINKIWIENKSLGPPLAGGNLKSYIGQLRFSTAASSLSPPLVRALDINLLVDATTNKVQYCYLNESIALKTCSMTGGVFDPSKAAPTPQCIYPFTNVSCVDASGCVTGIDHSTGHEGNLICTGPIIAAPTPTPPPTPCNQSQPYNDILDNLGATSGTSLPCVWQGFGNPLLYCENTGTVHTYTQAGTDAVYTSDSRTFQSCGGPQAWCCDMRLQYRTAYPQNGHWSKGINSTCTVFGGGMGGTCDSDPLYDIGMPCNTSQPPHIFSTGSCVLAGGIYTCQATKQTCL